MSFCTQEGPHISGVKPINIYQDNKNRSTYSLLFYYNNNGHNGPHSTSTPSISNSAIF